MKDRRIYLASSWRNPRQPEVVRALREAGFPTYDFRHPKPGDDGFHWSEIEPDWQTWDAASYRLALSDPVADRGYALDYGAMEWADTGVLLLPCGRSAHLEAGYFVGAAKDLFIVLDTINEPELMYKMADAICLDVAELLGKLG